MSKLYKSIDDWDDNSDYASYIDEINYYYKQLKENQKENEKLEQQLKETQEKLKIAVDALKFYANKKSWCYASSGGLKLKEGMTSIKDDFDLLLSCSGYAEMWYGGKIARQALEKIGEK